MSFESVFEETDNNKENADEIEKNKEEREILPSKYENIPPLKEGFMRLVHITDPNTAQKIADFGLNYELQGMISSTARAFSKTEDVVLENEDRRFSFSCARAVIIDIPIDEFRIHNNPTKSPGILPAKYVVGIVNVNPNDPDDKIFTRIKKIKAKSEVNKSGNLPENTNQQKIKKPVIIPEVKQNNVIKDIDDEVWD